MEAAAHSAIKKAIQRRDFCLLRLGQFISALKGCPHHVSWPNTRYANSFSS
jgi:hypothetical protein